jgi:hypothetical protein
LSILLAGAKLNPLSNAYPTVLSYRGVGPKVSKKHLIVTPYRLFLKKLFL